jgi:hypothetical protein
LYAFGFCKGTKRKISLIASWFLEDQSFRTKVKCLKDQRLGTEAILDWIIILFIIYMIYLNFKWFIIVSLNFTIQYGYYSRFKNSSARHYFNHGCGVEQYKDQILVLIVHTFRAWVSLCENASLLVMFT